MEEKGMIIVELDGEKKSVQSYERKNGFDPMTGEAIVETVIKNGFDPMTGESAYAVVKKNGFDPMTGEQLYVIASEKKESAIDNQTPIDPKETISKIKEKTSGNKALKYIGIGAAAVAVIAIIAAICVNVFIPKQLKILKAVAKTIEEDTFGSALIESSNILGGGDFNCDAEVDVSTYGVDVEFEGSAGINIDKAMIGGSGSFDAMGVSQEVGFYFDDSKLQVGLPDLTGNVYEYNYTKKNNGSLADFIEEYTDGDIDDLNNIFKSIASILKKSEKITKETQKAAIKPLMKVKIEKTDKREFEIDGKDRKCAGYKIKLTDRDIEAMLDAYNKAQKNACGKEIDTLRDSIENLTGETMLDTDDIMDELYWYDDIEVKLYLYKGMLAAIVAEIDDEEVQIQFKGGDNRTSNMVVKYDKTKIFERESSVSGKKETGKLKVFGEKLDYSYDMSSGKFSIDVLGTDIEAVYLVKGNKIKFEIDEDISGVDVNIKLGFEKGARISPLKGKTFDIGNADEDELYDEVEEIMDEFDFY